MEIKCQNNYHDGKYDLQLYIYFDNKQEYQNFDMSNVFSTPLCKVLTINSNVSIFKLPTHTSTDISNLTFRDMLNLNKQFALLFQSEDKGNINLLIDSIKSLPNWFIKNANDLLLPNKFEFDICTINADYSTYHVHIM